jgi:hypothetical protein
MGDHLVALGGQPPALPHTCAGSIAVGFRFPLPTPAKLLDILQARCVPYDGFAPGFTIGAAELSSLDIAGRSGAWPGEGVTHAHRRVRQAGA